MLNASRDKKSILEKRHIKLSWILLEHKCLYYVLNKAKYNHLRISDSDYDTLEKYYIYVCKKLKIKPSISKMVGFDQKKPSCNIVLKKLLEKKEITPFEKILKKARNHLEKN